MKPENMIRESSGNEALFESLPSAITQGLRMEGNMLRLGNESDSLNNDTSKTTIGESETNLTPGRRNLRKWLGKTFRVVITDGRVLVGFFNCTDKDANLVLSMCAEYLEEGKDARILGNVMVPGKHIVSISVDEPSNEMLVTET